ncbi:M20 family metallopeptidase [Ideonella sp. 4Y16]|uniref:M20 family metallopeptidase n=1 Tax=Ideonella alba TaxID=2824118 RepID=UPI001B38EDF0|nr:M20 family metallopeptidase [Ideonella alba]MBQ0946535.1 M20 family metallopeptidase [Ideonella alba]
MNAPETLPPLDSAQLGEFVDVAWRERIVPQLVDYIAVPAKSPMFDADWSAHGLIDRVVRDAAAWVEGRKVPGLRLEVLRLDGRTPVIFFELDATKPGNTQTVLMYGHLDKQPEFSGWRSDLGPWTPKIEDGKLFGRGGADDGYAIYASISAIEALKAQGVPHPRIVGLIETCEESGSYDLPAYLDALKGRLGDVSLVVCLDSGAGNYDQLWLTSSLRGNITGTLKVEILTEGIHSGDASGLVPSSFRIMRMVLDRLEEAKSGQLLPGVFHCEIPTERVEQARATAAILGDEVWKRYPWACGADGGFTLPTTTDPVEALLNRTWRPTLSITGVDGMPALANAGNVLRPYTAFKLSLRLPPLVPGHEAAVALKALLEDNAPYNAKVTFEPDGRMDNWGATGWNAPSLAPWLEQSMDRASRRHFGAPLGFIGQGGTIPLMNLLQQGFPAAQMMVCGVLGPKSNAHGPNEFLHIGYGTRLTAAVAEVIAGHP